MSGAQDMISMALASEITQDDCLDQNNDLECKESILLCSDTLAH